MQLSEVSHLRDWEIIILEKISKSHYNFCMEYITFDKTKLYIKR